jgi:exodeoxyribonuclease VII small subunit
MTEQSLETVFEQLDEIVEQLEAEDISLEDSFGLYHKGMDLLKVCNEKIDTIEKKMMMLDENGEEHEF